MSLSPGRDRAWSRQDQKIKWKCHQFLARRVSHSLHQREREPSALNSEERYDMLIQQQRAGFDLKDPFRSYVPVLWQTMIHSFPAHDSCRARYPAVKSLGFRMYRSK